MNKRNRSQNIIQLSEEHKKVLAKEIEAFYLDVRGESIGIIGCQQIIDLFMENMAPVVYNQALDDVQKWYKRIADNIESDYYSLYKEN
ncbi:DUF2164 domain-containing protein [Lachnospiraceae bacterium OttesenSCG-928-D06]|nr:DUF2164 domain-containing protein [Lachnospiraceae bacterium OttesenSCG-928-D06]